MNKKIIFLVLYGILTTSLWGCGSAKKEHIISSSDRIIEAPQKTPEVTDSDIVLTTVAPSTTPVAEIPEESDVFKIPDVPKGSLSFGDLKNVEFWFGSGVGGWNTTLYINEDGSFEGIYHDSDMGDIGDGYPNGTYYECVFHGHFSELKKVNEYCYSTSIKKISSENPTGVQEIIDGTLYVYSYPYGLENSDEILIYLPGTPTNQLPEGYLSWTRFGLQKDYTSQELVDTLPFYGLYNVTMEEGFSSYYYDELTILQNMLRNTEFMSETLEKELQNNNLTLNESYEKTHKLYELWDSALNDIWKQLKNTLPKDVMKKLTVEERQWIVQKEQAIEESGASYVDESLKKLVMEQTAVQFTKERVYVLMKYFEQANK